MRVCSPTLARSLTDLANSGKKLCALLEEDTIATFLKVSSSRAEEGPLVAGL